MTGEPVSSKDDIKPEGDGIRETLARIFKELTEIRVVTAVGDVEIALRRSEDGATIKTDVQTTGKNAKALVTIFDLIDGDVTNMISPDLLGDESLRAFHSAQVEKSIKVIPEHIRALIEVGQKISQM
ncbi:hypothetical protein [Phytohabitans houttuyneae]|uniref:Uncharacterized protein n=1 Tax=Phytohabitans houttuyneae TaxID=1076126 RepID=A0A6V8KG60_9ACTN|nr:hypothetical protein [Phytohabitans houttuyneae]GFJ81026.1 hypothetical protein Phou_052060 [Phytohabitans houttuyneae]